MRTEETPERLIRFLSTWSDKVLDKDWPSALGGPLGDDIVLDYVNLRRRAEGWRPRKPDANSHRAIPPAALADLLTGVSTGDRKACEHCGGEFSAKRRTRVYCSQTCRKAASRVRESVSLPSGHVNSAERAAGGSASPSGSGVGVG